MTIDPTVVASERMNRFNLYDLLLPAGDPVVTLDAAVGPGVGGFVVADGPEVRTPDITRLIKCRSISLQTQIFSPNRRKVLRKIYSTNSCYIDKQKPTIFKKTKNSVSHVKLSPVAGVQGEDEHLW